MHLPPAAIADDGTRHIRSFCTAEPVMAEGPLAAQIRRLPVRSQGRFGRR